MTSLDWLALSARLSPRLVALILLGGLLLFPNVTNSLLMSAAREEGKRVGALMERMIDNALGDQRQSASGVAKGRCGVGGCR